MKYRNKPIVIEAWVFDGTYTCLEMLITLGVKVTSFSRNINLDEAYSVRISTLEGVMAVSEGDFIIKGVKGDFYPCKPDIFEMTYNKVEDQYART